MLYTVVDTETIQDMPFWNSGFGMWTDDASNLSGDDYKYVRPFCDALNSVNRNTCNQLSDRYVIMTLHDARAYQDMVEL